MTPAQIRTIARITARADAQSRFLTTEDTDYIDGPLVSEVRGLATHSVLLIIHNSTPERKWFQKSRSAFVVIGVRGGVRVTEADLTGFNLHTFTMRAIKAKLAARARREKAAA